MGFVVQMKSARNITKLKNKISSTYFGIDIYHLGRWLVLVPAELKKNTIDFGVSKIHFGLTHAEAMSSNQPNLHPPPTIYN